MPLLDIGHMGHTSHNRTHLGIGHKDYTYKVCSRVVSDLVGLVWPSLEAVSR